VVVTGASEGIGRALCLALATRGVRLVIAARDSARLEELATLCAERGGECLAVPTDVADEPACRLLIERTLAAYGRLDVLVNNAGITMWARFDTIDDDSILENVMRVNFFGAVWLTRYALPHLKTTHGRLVAIASVAGLTGVPERSMYAASKHAMIGFFESLRIELAPQGVTVTIVAPDFVATQIHRRALRADGSPAGTSPMREARIISAAACARRIVLAIDRRERLVVTSARGRLGRWMRLVWPALVDRIAARAIARKY
jgi:NAD(P)-dependent dehydrogenase (short-subunit alcohol dehydrogenase family)